MIGKVRSGIMILTGLLLVSCSKNVDKLALKASVALAHGNYKGALKALTAIPDKTLEKNDSLFLMLAEAYYGQTSSTKDIDAQDIVDLDLTPDGKNILFTDLRSAKIVEYSFPDLRFKRTINAPSAVYAIDFAPDGSQFAIAQLNANIDLYDYRTGARVKSLLGHTNQARAVVFLDSTHLMSGGNDQYNITWDLSQNKMIDHQWRHRKNVKSLKKSTDGNYVVSTSNDGTAIIWDFRDKEKGKEFHKIAHGRNYVNDGALSPDNELMVTVSGDGDAKIWDVKTGKLIESIPLEDVGCSVEFSPDGQFIAIGGKLYVHLINTGKMIEETKIPLINTPVWALKILPGNMLVFADSPHFNKIDLLSRSELIKAAKEWAEENKD